MKIHCFSKIIKEVDILTFLHHFHSFFTKFSISWLKSHLLSYLFRKKGRHHRLDTPAFSCTFKNFLQKILTIFFLYSLSGCLLASAFEWGYSYANWAHFNISSGKGQKNLVKFHKKSLQEGISTYKPVLDM